MTEPFFAEDDAQATGEDYLDEGELLLDDDEDDGGFEDEATAVFNPEEHGAWASPQPDADPWGETELEEIV
jgi:hypothetical protein